MGGAALGLALAGCSSGDGGGGAAGTVSNGGLDGNVPIGSSAEPVVLADLLGAYVSESCGHGPGNLVDGALPGIESGSGQVHASWRGYHGGDTGAPTKRQLSGVFSWDGNAVMVEDVQG